MTAEEATSIVQRLRAVLDPLAAAMAGADLDELLRLEPELAAVMSTIPVPARGAAAVPAALNGHAALGAEILAARAALVRCRRLGTALIDFRRFGLQARGAGAEYDRGGREQGGATVHAFQLRG